MSIWSTANQIRYAAIARRYGIRNALVAIQEGKKVGIGPALAIAMLEQESHGKNVWGHDPTIFIGGYDAKHRRYWTKRRSRRGYVNKRGYQEYKRQRASGSTPRMQGVGPMQLTWWTTQDLADKLGGCWKPRYNIKTGFRILSANIKQYGLRDGIRRYNGSGAAAEAYARSVLARQDAWQRRFKIK